MFCATRKRLNKIDIEFSSSDRTQQLLNFSIAIKKVLTRKGWRLRYPAEVYEKPRELQTRYGLCILEQKRRSSLSRLELVLINS